MKFIAWDVQKNEKLKRERGISFEEAMDALLGDGLIKTERNPNRQKYPLQYVHILKIKRYAYIVPFVEDNEKYFLKTIIPSRKATKRYIKKKEAYESKNI